MQTITKTFNVYKFEELGDTVREKIISQWRNDEPFNTDYVYEDATTILKLIGFEDTRIEYNGFYSQGDGASFTGDYSFKEDALKQAQEYAPQDELLHSTVQTLQLLQNELYNNKMTAEIRRISHCYSHENTVSTTAYVEGVELDGDLSQQIGETFKNLMRWIYKQLKVGYEDWYGANHIKEEIIANDYDFLKDGTIYTGE